ncbi:MAG: LPS export ABC transporter periplasmic protein LptC [Cyanobacteria bacterium J06641_5]
MGWSRWLAAGLGAIAIATTMGACRGDDPIASEQPPAADADELDRRLILENATLNQADDDGKPLWDINAARVAYSPDREEAELESLTGNFYEDGELALQIRAREGTLLRSGEEIVLEGDISAIDPRNEAVLRAQEARWFPDKQQLILRENFSGNHPRLDLTADEGIYDAVAQSFTARGDIKAVAKEPSVLLQAEVVVWNIAKEIVSSDRPLQIDRFDENTTTDRITAERATVNLGAEVVTLRGNVELRSVEPPVQIASNLIAWRIADRIISTNMPIRIVHAAAEIDVTGNRGRYDLAREIVTLSGGVEGRSTPNEAELYTNRLEWNIRNQQMRAQGDVRYRQENPLLIAKGDSAVGNLKVRKISLRSKKSQSQGVVSEFEF